MRYRKLGNTDIDISLVSIGAWAIGGDSNWGESDDAMSVRTIHKARDLGINLLDTAPAYGLGHSEEVVGLALKGRRSDYILSTKCGLVWDGSEGSFKMAREGTTLLINLSRESIRQQLEASLRRLQTDYIDIFITHWQSIEPYKTPIAETMDELNKIVKEGKIRSIGVSNVTPDDIDEYSRHGQIALVQQKFSLLDRTNEATIMPRCADLGITFQAYSPLERGILTGKINKDTPIVGNAKITSPWFKQENREKTAELLKQFQPLCQHYNCTMTNLIIAWTAAQMEQINVLCGARKIDHVIENAGGADLILNQADLDKINQMAKAVILNSDK
jgi:methylglyoxal reductase